jgi:hypothetical protein
MQEEKMPKEIGFYRAREQKYKWWNLILRIFGIPPYLRCEAWKIDDQSIIPDSRRYDLRIAEIGPKIPDPEEINYDRQQEE